MIDMYKGLWFSEDIEFHFIIHFIQIQSFSYLERQ